MRRLLLSITRFAWILLLCPAFGAPTAAAQSDRASEVIQYVNAYRVSNGLPALPVSSALVLAAQRHADWQAANHTSSHQEDNGSMPDDRAAAAGYGGTALENVAAGTLGWATTAWSVEGWASSYGHRMTMLDASATDIGAGVADDTERTFFVLLIGHSSTASYARSSSAPAAEAPTASPTAQQIAYVAPIVIATPDADGTVRHVVQEGQTAWALAARYGVSLDDLLALNSLTRSAVLHPGDVVVIQLGAGQAPPPSPTVVNTHRVTEGETLWGIAAQNGLTLDDLLALNGLQRGAIIKPGDVLLLHAIPATPTPTATPGETVSATAAATATASATFATAAVLMPSPASSSPPLPEFSPTPVPTRSATPTPAPTATLAPTLIPSPSPTTTPTASPAPAASSRRTDVVLIAGALVLGLIGIAVIAGGAALLLLVRRT